MTDAPSIDVIVEDPRWTSTLPGADRLAQQAVSAAFAGAEYSQAVALSVLLADDNRVQVLNRDFRGQDKPTNVLSFPAEETPVLPGESPHLGDIALAFETLTREAQDADKPFGNHFQHLIVHASLHLIGYTHEQDEDAERMEALEIAALDGLGVPNPYEETGDGQTAYGTREP